MNMAVRRAAAIFLSGFLILLPGRALAFVLAAPLEGTVGIAMERFAIDTLGRADREGASLVVFMLDTPGGLVSSMRAITSAILESPVPVAVWVSPSGARAASAGAFILQAAHVAAMAPGTNAGAAHPVMASGKDAPDEEMKKKITNDLAAQMRSLSQLRKRNMDAAERMVTESLSITAEEALSMGVADLLARDMESLLLGIRGRETELRGRTVFLDPPLGPPVVTGMTPGEKILQFISSPDIAYLLLTAGVLAIVFEVLSPGGFVLGTAGAVMVLMGAFGLRMLPFNWAGIILSTAGIAVIILDLLVGGIGVLSLFGLAALATGGLILFRAPGGELLNVSMSFVAGVSIALGLFFFSVLWFSLRSMKKKVSSGAEGMIGMEAEVLEDLDPVGLVRCRGEIWKAKSGEGGPVLRGEKGVVSELKGMVLVIGPEEGAPSLIAETGKNEKGDEP